ncbi:MAG TPA: ABC transporter permease [Candidatus Eremiobacteraceae bacterium]|nr:ABC transporter permease [Candidatus Eremiobacteraceae bacterium]
MRSAVVRAGGFALAFVLALAAASVVLLASKVNPFGAFAALLDGAFGSREGFAETLAQTSTLLFAGLGVGIALRAGLFNVGAEGQLVLGGLCAAVVGAHLDLAWPLEIPLCLAAGALGGASLAAIAGWLRARFGASEVISTIMLNYIAIACADYLVNGPLRGSASIPETSAIAPSAVLPPLIADTRLTAAFPLAVAAALLLAWWLARTVAGYELRAVGKSERAARYAGIDVRATVVRAMALSGALAGLGGATEVMALLHHFNAELSPGYGFTSIAVALLAGASPAGTVATALLFGALQNGALAMQALAGAPKDAVSIVQGFVVLFVAANWFGRAVRIGGAAAALAPDAEVAGPVAEGA